MALLLFHAGFIFLVSACSLGGINTSMGAAAPPPPVPTAMDTFRALAPPDGLKFTPLFSEHIRDTDARIQRLENAVQSVRNDFDTVVPAIVRMAAVEKDIKGLTAQLQTLTDQSHGIVPPTAPVPEQKSSPPETAGNKIPGGDIAKGTSAKAVIARAAPAVPSLSATPGVAPKGELPSGRAASPSFTKPASTMPVDLKPPAAVAETKAATVPAPAALPTPAPVPTLPPLPQISLPSSPAPPSVSAPASPPSSAPMLGAAEGFRFSDSPDKTRIVVDTTAKTAATTRLENSGKMLVITLPQLKWLGKTSWDADSSQLISGYHMEGDNLYVDLMYAAHIKSQELLSPGGGVRNYRLVIDLFSPEVHK